MSQHSYNPAHLIKKDYRYALFGASNNRDHQAFRVVILLERYGYKVMPISPRENKIMNLSAFPDLRQTRPFPDVAICAFEKADIMSDEKLLLSAIEDMNNNNIKKVLIIENNFTHAVEELCKRYFVEYALISLDFLHKTLEDKNNI